MADGYAKSFVPFATAEDEVAASPYLACCSEREMGQVRIDSLADLNRKAEQVYGAFGRRL